MKILTAPQSGSQAGTTASRNRFGQYLRSRAIPVQPRTPKQTLNRANFTLGSNGWRQLTDTQRTAWNDYAAQISRSDSLGSQYQPTGAELYTGALVTNPGLAVTDPPATLPIYVLAVDTITYVDPAPGPEAFGVTVSFTSPDNSVLIETSGPLSPGVTSAASIRKWNSLPNSDINRQAMLFSLAASPIDFLTQYKRLFPSPSSGQVIWFRFREIFTDASNAGIVNKNLQTYRFVVP